MIARYLWPSGVSTMISRSLLWNFFLWGHFKTVVYADPPLNLQGVKNKIIIVCIHLTEQQILSATHKETNHRLETCLSANEVNFKQFIIYCLTVLCYYVYVLLNEQNYFKNTTKK